MSLRIGRGTRPRGSALENVSREDLQRLVAVGDDGLELQDRLVLAQAIRAVLGDAGAELDRFLLERVLNLGSTIERVRHAQEELKVLLTRYQQGPWHPAVFLGHVPGAAAPRVLVTAGSARRIVGVVREIDASALAPGDEVYLDDEHGLVVATSPFGMPASADTARFERALPGGRLLLRWHGDELVVAAASAALQGAPLSEGDLVRWDRTSGMAFERLDQQAERSFVIEEVPDLARDRVGGQDENLDRLLDALTCTLVDPGRARHYGLVSRQSILLYGPPGSGKTLLARIAAAEIQRLTGKRCRFAVVKPGEWESPWVGETQARIRACFRELRDAARDGHAILFLDEVESAGRMRGSAVGHHDDKFLTALLAEIDGFAERAGVAIIAATNRKDLLDPALYERLSDVELRVGRPDMAGARRIFEIHLGEAVPYATTGQEESVDPRGVLIDLAIARLYSPNGDNALCRLRLRDGTSRTVAARELLSGRAIEQLCREVRAAAFRREVKGGDPGVARRDVEEAVAWTLEKLTSTLTPRNCRAYLADLPQDVDVVGVEPVGRKVARRHHYLTAA